MSFDPLFMFSNREEAIDLLAADFERSVRAGEVKCPACQTLLEMHGEYVGCPKCHGAFPAESQEETPDAP